MTSESITEHNSPHEPVTGHYFVSAYPPFSCWEPGTLAAFQQALDCPPPEGAPCP